jgi:hypothetical protein
MPIGLDDFSLSSKGYNKDSFGRDRIGIPQTQYEYDFQYNKAPLIWGEKATGSGTATHLPNESSIELSNGSTTDTHGIIRQTFKYFRYRPGKSLEFQETFAFGAITENVVKRVGYYDADDGIYFEQDGVNSVYNLVLRSSTTGSPVNNLISQDNWNIDKLDGTGTSGITADFTKVQILSVGLQWLGVGSVLCGFVINRIFYPVHIFNHANSLTSVYMKTPNLPVRYEIVNSGTAGGIDTMKQICATVITNGGIDKEFSYVHSLPDVVSKTGISTTYVNIVNIRPKSTFNSITNRGQILPARVEINNVGSGTLYWQLVYNSTLGGTPSYTSVGNNSITEYDVAGTTLSGGEIIDSGTLQSTNQSKSAQSANVGALYPLTLDIDGLNPKNLVLAVKAATGTVDVTAHMTFLEIY